DSLETGSAKRAYNGLGKHARQVQSGQGGASPCTGVKEKVRASDTETPYGFRTSGVTVTAGESGDASSDARDRSGNHGHDCFRRRWPRPHPGPSLRRDQAVLSETGVGRA